MLQAIVEAAPSPKAADEHVLTLGWSNETARKVRCAVRARQKCKPGQWSEMSSTSARPATEMFKFGPAPPVFQTQPDFPYNLKASSVFTMAGQSVSHADAPFFLREIAKQDHTSPLTSVDGRGEYYKMPQTADLASWPFDFSEEDGEVYASNLPVGIGRNQSAWGIACGYHGAKMRARTCLLMVPSRFIKNPFPEFYKVADFEQTWENGHDRQRMRVCVRADFGPKRRERSGDSFWGWVDFERATDIHYSVYYATQARFNVWLGGKVTLNNEFYRLGGPRLVEHWKGRPAGVGPFYSYDVYDNWILKAVQTATADHWQTLCAIYRTDENRRWKDGMLAKHVEYPTIERFAGLSLLTDPPDRLSDLFIKE